FHVDTGWLVPVPESIPAKRATLSANMETALNAIWDSGAAPADQIIVIGAGIVGLLVSYLASRIPGTTVTLVDVAENRESFALAMGARFALPANAPRDADIVFHTSANAAGLRTAMDCAGFEATIVEMSWYGSRPVETFLGESFHANRLRLISSQVGHVAPSHRARWTHRRRIEAAIGLLDAPELDCLVADEIQFADAAAKLPRIFANDWPDLPPVIRYT
ncbi:MAG TPA: zinc-binding alcohol dehydrogenase, partial [Hyphomicrobiaceae bacterium]|nr:zinc-binding alcohol dehydrogenase [Hyphomicrobiaceae bacterium]